MPDISAELFAVVSTATADHSRAFHGQPVASGAFGYPYSYLFPSRTRTGRFWPNGSETDGRMTTRGMPLDHMQYNQMIQFQQCAMMTLNPFTHTRARVTLDNPAHWLAFLCALLPMRMAAWKKSPSHSCTQNYSKINLCFLIEIKSIVSCSCTVCAGTVRCSFCGFISIISVNGIDNGYGRKCVYGTCNFNQKPACCVPYACLSHRWCKNDGPSNVRTHTQTSAA